MKSVKWARFLALFLLIATGCAPAANVPAPRAPEPKTAADHLYEVQGCDIYKIKDGDKVSYFSVCPDSSRVTITFGE